MPASVDSAALATLREQPIDWRFKGLPPHWSGRTVAQVCADTPRLFAGSGADDPFGPVCMLRADALTHNLATMARWCAEHRVELAPHGKTHMSPQLAALQFAAGATALTVATVHQLRTYHAFGVRDFLLANELVDPAGLRWLAAELNRDPQLRVVCWVDSIRGVALMAAELAGAGLQRPLDVCIEVGARGGRTGTRTIEQADEVAAAVLATQQLRLVGVAGYEAALGHDVSETGRAVIRGYLQTLRAAVLRLADSVLSDGPVEMLVTAGGSTHFDLVTEILTDWPSGLPVRTVLRSGCYLTHDDGLYGRISALRGSLRPALSVRAQVCSRPESELALCTMGRRDVSFDQDLPIPRGIAGQVTQLNDQHAYLRLEAQPARSLQVGDWVEFGISHPCTVFDKWQLIPLLDADDRVVDLIRTFF